MALLRRMSLLVLTVALLIAAFAGGWLVARLGLGASVDPASLSEAEHQFTERMRDVSLVGTFTVDGRGDRGTPTRIATTSRASRRSATTSGDSPPTCTAVA